MERDTGVAKYVHFQISISIFTEGAGVVPGPKYRDRGHMLLDRENPEMKHEGNRMATGLLQYRQT